MRRVVAVMLLGVALAMFTVTPAYAAACEFRLGFKTLRDLIGHEVVGECLESEHYNEIGDSNQQTTGGLMAWRKADNWTAFTDGYRSWINGPNGLVQRLNSERFSWEADHIHTPPPTPGPAPPPASTPVPQPSIDPTLAHAYHVMRSTRTGNFVADKFSQLGASAGFGNVGNLIVQWELSPRRITVNEKYRYESYETLAYALIWATVALIVEIDEGLPESWKECMDRIVLQEGMQSQYWFDVFGESGKSNPTELEDWANIDLSWYVAEIHDDLGWDIAGALEPVIWLNPYYRKYCEEYGAGAQIDSELALALIASMQAPTQVGYKAVDVIHAAGTTVVFDNINSWGVYSLSRNRIAINASLRGQSKEVLASILVHEAVHVLAHQDRGGRPQATAAECLQEELNAFRVQASWWERRYGRYGVRYPNGAQQALNGLVSAWFNQSIKEWVLLSEGYQNQCLGGVVE